MKVLCINPCTFGVKFHIRAMHTGLENRHIIVKSICHSLFVLKKYTSVFIKTEIRQVIAIFSTKLSEKKSLPEQGAVVASIHYRNKSYDVNE